MIIVNFKNYKKGKEVLELAKKIEKTNKNIFVAIPSLNINEVSKNTKLNVLAQSINYIENSRGTGLINAESIKSSGAIGTLLNHSENKLGFSELKKIILDCKKNKIKSIVFVKNLSEAKKIKPLSPDAIAYEDPKLVSSGKSIVEHREKEIRNFSKLFSRSKIIPICGAGISSKEDIEKAKILGCKGVAIGSAIAKKENLGILA